MVEAVRDADIADVPEILAMIRELAEFEHLSHAVVCSEELLQRHCFGPDATVQILIAQLSVPGRVEPQIIGFALFFPTFSTFLGRPGVYLEDLFIRSQWRRQGYGKCLLTRVIAWAHEHGCGRVEWAVLDWNHPAIAFYRSIGAVPLDEWTTFRLTGSALESCRSQ